MQAKDLDTVRILSFAKVNPPWPGSISYLDIQKMYPDAPMKLIYAKIYILVRNGFVETVGPSNGHCILMPRGLSFLNSELNKGIQNAQPQE